MLNLNKNKLIPATEIIAYWGEIKGDISKQTDLVELTTDLDTSIKGWVTSQGFLTEHQDLSSYALKSDIPSLDGYATESWVTNQGYISSIPDTFATKDWVESQSYLTSVSLNGYATESWVSSQQFATQSWVSSQGYLTEHQDLTGYATESWVSNQLSYYTTNSEYASLQSRVATLEENYGDAIGITNLILQ